MLYRGGSTLSVDADVTIITKSSAAVPKLAVSSATLAVGEQLSLIAAKSPVQATACSFKSSNPAVAAVNAEGVATGVKVGKATILVTYAGNTQKVMLTIKAGPSSVTLNREALTLGVGATFQLKASIPRQTYTSGYSWKSSNSAVAKVGKSGKVTAVALGSAKITVETGNGKKASCRVTVSKYGEVKYRALLIGQKGFSDIGEVCATDVEMMQKVLNKVRGPEGGAYAVAAPVYNVSSKDVENSIKRAFANADANDVSLFFITSHGDFKSKGKNAGRIKMYPSGYLKLSALANMLRKVPGKVIVILETCGSGAAVYTGNGEEANAVKENLKRFDAGVIEAFSKADCGVIVDSNGNAVEESDVWGNTGEFRVANKFYVLTAAGYQEQAWSQQGGDLFLKDLKGGWFVMAMKRGIGTSGRMPADKNNNGVLTLNELYLYAKNHMLTTLIQHAQVYPKNSTYGLFKRK